MSAKLLRGDLGGIVGFHWQPTGDPELRGTAQNGTSKPGGGHLPNKGKVEPESPRTITEQRLEATLRELADAQAQAQNAARAAFQQGLVEGLKQAAEAGQAEIERYQGRLAESLANLAEARQRLLSETENDLLRLSVAIAEKILNRHLQIDGDALRGVARASLERLADKPVQGVRMHPEDQNAVMRELSGLETKGMRFLPDESVTRGSLLFETDYGVLDCSIATQLEEIEHGLIDRLQRSQR